jgi:hypothetical protein
LILREFRPIELGVCRIIGTLGRVGFAGCQFVGNVERLAGVGFAGFGRKSGHGSLALLFRKIKKYIILRGSSIVNFFHFRVQTQ